VRRIRTVKDEERIYDAQGEEIEKKYGKKASVNYGWFADDYMIQSKIYVNPQVVLTSYYEGEKIVHEWEER